MLNLNIKKKYTSKDIKILEGLEAIRKRPSMYIGSTSSKGMHHLIWEILNNSIDESLAGFANLISLKIKKNNIVSIYDNGRGIPVGIHEKTKISTVETIFTTLHSGGKFENNVYKVSGGLHGVGAAVVNALSVFLKVKVYLNKFKYFVEFKNGGNIINPLTKIGKTKKKGTLITFKPDFKIFKETKFFSKEIIYKHLKKMAFLNKNVKFVFLDETKSNKKKKYIFFYKNGIKDYIKFLNNNKNFLHKKIFYTIKEKKNTIVEISVQYNDSYNSNILSFCNNINTSEGGTHEDGFRSALTRSINFYAKKNNFLKKDENNFLGEDVREGIVAIISIKHKNPQFEGQTKTKLGNSEIKNIVSSIFINDFKRFLYENPDIAKIIIKKSIIASKARIAAKKTYELTRKKNILENSTLPGKLSDCSCRNPEKSEIFIVEGDSAGGSAKQGRNSTFQAILPLKGKILNVEKARLHKIFENDEIKSMITAFRAGISDNIDLKKLKYHKIIIMTDADVDGAHIRILLLTFFFRFLKPLIEKGYIFIAQPPLYKVSFGSKFKYFYSKKNIPISKKKKINIQRFKGLGEMNPEQLWDTTMDPKKRKLINIKIHDAEEANSVFNILMGNNVILRRNFIQKNFNLINKNDIDF